MLRGVSFPGVDTPGSSRAPLRGEEAEFRFEISELREEADSREVAVEGGSDSEDTPVGRPVLPGAEAQEAEFRFEISELKEGADSREEAVEGGSDSEDTPVGRPVPPGAEAQEAEFRFEISELREGDAH